MTENSLVDLQNALGVFEAERLPTKTRVIFVTEEILGLIPEFIDGAMYWEDLTNNRVGLRIPIRQGEFVDQPAFIGDYLIEAEDGSWYPVSSDNFKRTYKNSKPTIQEYYDYES